jgi:hypothetical protein
MNSTTLPFRITDVASHAKPFHVSLIAHLAQLRDGLVIRLVFLDSGRSEPDQRAHNHHDQGGELAVFFHANL